MLQYIMCVHAMKQYLGSYPFVINSLLFFTILFCYNLGKVFQSIYIAVFLSLNSIKKFKTIFDNLEESIIIIQEQTKTIEYANIKFFDEFEEQILQLFQSSS